MEQLNKWPGEDVAWQRLGGLPPHVVQARAGARFDGSTGDYTLVCFGQLIRVAPADRRVSSATALGAILAGTLNDYSRLAILSYLCTAQETTATGTLAKPEELRGGMIFVQGTHVLPLPDLARRYDRDRAGFLARGCELGGTPLGHGDMSIRLAPFPRLPLTLVLWAGDNEFPPRATLLLDPGSAAPFAADMIWATANITIALMRSPRTSHREQGPS